MKTNKHLIMIVIFVFVLIQSNIVIVTSHFDGENIENVNLEDADDHCTNPTEEVLISANGPASYDRNIIEIPAETCVTIWFQNLVNVKHDFVILPVNGSKGIAGVYMSLDNSTAFCGQATSDDETTPGLARFNILTPKYNVVFEYFCSIPGHHSSGMFGELRIIDGK
ncbi:MAG: hypothetical protein OEZ01_13035, partial [Candidatus Heimdallarchaeota archaeon]|nr:hypothetical protein [Candidatus Heimdallarchaeota archaeon]